MSASEYAKAAPDRSRASTSVATWSGKNASSSSRRAICVPRLRNELRVGETADKIAHIRTGIVDDDHLYMRVGLCRDRTQSALEKAPRLVVRADDDRNER